MTTTTSSETRWKRAPTALFAAIAFALTGCVSAPTLANNPSFHSAVRNELSKPRLATSVTSQLDTTTGIALVFSIEPTPKTLDDHEVPLSEVDHKVSPVAIAQSLPIGSSEQAVADTRAVRSATIDTATSLVIQSPERESERDANVGVPAREFHESLAICGYASGQFEIPSQHVNAMKLFADKAISASSVAVIGFTDKVGTSLPNTAIARARANRVARGLLKQGVNAANVRVFECTTCYDLRDDARSRRVAVVLSSTPPGGLSRERVIAFVAAGRAQPVAALHSHEACAASNAADALSFALL
jgi:outer membrane protein OmpA-like peptidoglycan-associated protein